MNEPAPGAKAVSQTDRTTLKRLPARGSYDRTVIDAILDEALICHLGFVADGSPVVIPTIHARVEDRVYVHGAVAGRALRTARNTPVCLTATIVDGIVVARSGFHSSMNYRAVMLFGDARVVDDPAEKHVALEAIVDHVIAGRTAQVRPYTDVEARQTMVLGLDITEGSAKVRTGGPVDDEEDYELDIWAGVLPLQLVPGTPIDDDRLKPGLTPPSNLTAYRRPS